MLLTPRDTKNDTPHIWTDGHALHFLTTHYPWFLPTYTSYPHPIQWADAIRYILLDHYGGIYLDLDMAPKRPLDLFLQYPFFACRTVPTEISNDVLGSVPGHPFIEKIIGSLRAYDRNLALPHVTVM